MEGYFRLHVIPPPRPLDWSSPRALLADTAYHHLIQDEAPIGHFYVEVFSGRPWKNGVSHFLTGMSRAKRNLSSIRIAFENVGLGTLFYDFPGKLDLGLGALKDIEWAKRKSRWKGLKVSLTEDQAHELFIEMDGWIRHGGFRHYGGGHQILKGEGSGCADLGAHFFRLSARYPETPADWVRTVHAPHALVGGGETGRSVSLFKVYREGREWATGPEQGLCYATPDMELTWAWLEKVAPGQTEIAFNPEWLPKAAGVPARIEFQAGYPLESEAEIERVWRSIKIA